MVVSEACGLRWVCEISQLSANRLRITLHFICKPHSAAAFIDKIGVWTIILVQFFFLNSVILSKNHARYLYLQREHIELNQETVRLF